MTRRTGRLGARSVPASNPWAGLLPRARIVLLAVALMMTAAVSDGAFAAPAQALGTGTTVTVALSLPTIIANGTSTTTATATVTDGVPEPVPGETVTITSTDPGQTIGPVTDHGDGTYTAQIRSSTTVGVSTITATDTSAAANPSGHATLAQTAGPPIAVSLSLAPPQILGDGHSTSAATARVTDAEGHPLVAQPLKVKSSDPGERVGPVTDQGNGSYTAAITSSTTVGPAVITASDGSLSSQAILTSTLGPATTISVKLTPPSIVADGSSTTTATALVTDAAGHPLSGDTVTFVSSDPHEQVAATTSQNGIYSALITSSTTPGLATITAIDTSASPQVIGQATLAQAANTSTTVLMALPGFAATNLGVALVATVTSSSSAVTPSGTVAFESRGIPISGCAAVPVSTTMQSATVTCDTSFAASTSPELLTAVFNSNRGTILSNSVSAPDALGVGRDGTATGLAASTQTLRIGQTVTYTATVTTDHAGSTKATGSVQFFDDGAPIASCSGRVLVATATALTAQCQVEYTTNATHLITAQYSGDSNFTGSPSTVQRVSAPAKPRVKIASTMQWYFYYSPTYTKVLTLRVQSATPGMRLLVTCSGGGCPYARHVIKVRKPKPCAKTSKRGCSSATTVAVNLGKSFGNHRLHPGARIKVQLSLKGSKEKSYLFTVRSRHAPRVQIH